MTNQVGKTQDKQKLATTQKVVDHSNMKLGKLPVKTDPRTLKFGVYLAAPDDLPPVPDSYAWGKGVKHWGMMKNDVIEDCTCFPPGTRIRMADGTTKEIEKINVLDKVVSGEGNEQLVTSIMARHIDEPLLKIVAWGHSHLRCTSGHPILTRDRGYVAAKDLLPGDWIAIQTYQPKGIVREIDTSQYFKKDDIRRIKRNGEMFDRNAKTPIEVKNVPKTIKLTPEFGEIIGLFLAEGSTCQNTVRWTFGSHEKETLVARLVEYLKQELDITSAVRPKGNGAIDVVVCGKDWMILFETLCSKGAAGKMIHKDLWRGDEQFLFRILKGWLLGDGYRRTHGVTGTSVSHALALDMVNLAQIIGLSPSIHGRQPKITNTKTARFRWDVSISTTPPRGHGTSKYNGVSWDKPHKKWVAYGNKAKHTVNLGGFDDEAKAGEVAAKWRKENNIWGDGRSYKDGNIVWHMFRESRQEPYSGYVFNLSVSNDESYIAEGISVHNCASMGHMILAWSDANGEELGVDSGSDTILGIPKNYVYWGGGLFAASVVVIWGLGFIKRKMASK